MTWEETSNLLRQIYPNCYELRHLRKNRSRSIAIVRGKTHGQVVQKACYLLLPCEGLKKDGLNSSFAPPAFFSIFATLLPITSTT